MLYTAPARTTWWLMPSRVFLLAQASPLDSILMIFMLHNPHALNFLGKGPKAHLDPVQQIHVPPDAFTHVHMDIVGPLPPSRGHSYLLTVIDRLSRWPKAFPMTKVTAEESARTFTLGWIACFGMPLDITSDRGCQFTSSIWNHLASSLGYKLHHMTLYHPQANGIIK